MTFSVKNKIGEDIDPSKYTWEEGTRTFCSSESELVIDFSKNGDGITFNLPGDKHIITAGNCCVFNTGSECCFETGTKCHFKTLWRCQFKTGNWCTFKTQWECIFIIEEYCTAIVMGTGCIFFNIQSNCMVVRQDETDTYVLPQGKSIRLTHFPERYIGKESDILIERCERLIKTMPYLW